MRLRRRLPRFSEREVIEPLAKKFGFTVRRQRGSHVVLVKYADDRKIVTVMLLHPELKPGTLLRVLELAEINREESLKAYKKDC